MKNKIKIIHLAFVLACVGIIVGCESKTTPIEKPVVVQSLPAIITPVFNEDSSYAYIAKQVSFGPRVPNTKEHLDCGEYLVRFFISQGGWVERQPFVARAFDGTDLNLKNIIVSYNQKATKRILLAAHWDTRPFADQDMENPKKPIDGANDGASGVGVLMELARALHGAEKQPEVGIDIILFDGEDYGQPMFYPGPYQENSWCLGSQHWAKNKHKNNYSAYYGILLDMVGGKDATFAKEGVSMQNAPSVVQNVWSTAERLGYGRHFISFLSDPITDDHTYINKIAMIPMIDIIEFDNSDGNYFGSYWHTHADNMDVIDKNTLKAVGQTLIEVLYREKL